MLCLRGIQVTPDRTESLLGNVAGLLGLCLEHDPVARTERVDLIRVAAGRSDERRSRVVAALRPDESDLRQHPPRPLGTEIEPDDARAVDSTTANEYSTPRIPARAIGPSFPPSRRTVPDRSASKPIPPEQKCRRRESDTRVRGQTHVARRELPDTRHRTQALAHRAGGAAASSRTQVAPGDTGSRCARSRAGVRSDSSQPERGRQPHRLPEPAP